MCAVFYFFRGLGYFSLCANVHQLARLLFYSQERTWFYDLFNTSAFTFVVHYLLRNLLFLLTLKKLSLCYAPKHRVHFIESRGFYFRQRKMEEIGGEQKWPREQFDHVRVTPGNGDNAGN